MIFVSASQISAYRECARKWAWRYIAGIAAPQHPSAALGTEVDDEQVQPYLLKGRPFDFAKPAHGSFLSSGEIAASMLPFLPAPGTVQVQRHFQFPSPTWQTAEFGFQGYVDIWTEDSRVLPGCAGGVPGVADTKTTSNIAKWAKTETQLKTDVQAMLYATEAMFATGAREVDLDWIYGQTRGSRKGKNVVLRVSADHVAEQFSLINETAVEMLGVRQSGAGPLDLPPSPDAPDACEAYGGCPYRDKCNLSPSQIIDSLAAKASKGGIMGNASDMLAALKAKKAAQTAGAGSSPPDAPPVVATKEAPAPPPSPSVQIPLPINPPECTAPPAEALAPKRGPGRPKKEAPTPAVTDAGPVCVTVNVTHTTFVREGETVAQAAMRACAELARGAA